MARETGTLKTVEKVLEWYDDNKGNHFSIWKGTGVQLQIRYSKMEETPEDNRRQLQNILETLRDSGDVVGYTIKLHPKPKKEQYYEKDDPAKASESFILCEAQPYVPNMYQGMVNPEIFALKQQLEAQQAKITALEMELNAEDEEEDEEEEPKSGISGILEGMLSRPDVQNALITGFVGAFAPQKPAKVMAGTQDSNIRQEALEILAANGVGDDDLMLLANLAINNPGQFSWLLKMLRNG